MDFRAERTGGFCDGTEMGLQQLGASRFPDPTLRYLQNLQEGKYCTDTYVIVHPPGSSL